MAGSTETKIGQTDPVPDKCMSIEEVMDLGDSDAISFTGVLRAQRDTELDTYATHVMTGISEVEVHVSGCVSEDDFTRAEVRVIDCPKDVAERCGNCILNIDGGAVLLERIKPAPLFTPEGDTYENSWA